MFFIKKYFVFLLDLEFFYTKKLCFRNIVFLPRKYFFFKIYDELKKIHNLHSLGRHACFSCTKNPILTATWQLRCPFPVIIQDNSLNDSSVYVSGKSLTCYCVLCLLDVKSTFFVQKW